MESLIQVTLPIDDSYLVICPWCYDAWARLVGQQATFWHRYVPCEKHPQVAAEYGCQVAGSLLDAEESLLDALPADLLQYEFELHIKSYEESLCQTPLPSQYHHQSPYSLE
jgi:hypothetical protein